MFDERKFRVPRLWSNKEIKKLAPLFNGDIVNVSAWKDQDKEDGYYKDYFTKADSYSITNYKGLRGQTGTENEIFLDLSEDLPHDLVEKYDVCFNHTTLEHIFDVRKAFSVICKMSRDIVFLIVPFSQTQHETEVLRDFWRFTPSAMHYLFEENNMTVIYQACSPEKNAGIYLLFIGSRFPDKWKTVLPTSKAIKDAGDWIGDSLLNKIAGLIKKVTCR